MASSEPLRLVDLLTQIGHEVRHFQQEHEREPPGGRTRRVLQGKMQSLTERFERLVGHWVAEPALRAAWLDYLRSGGDPPAEPQLAVPPLFKGRSEVGTTVEVRPSAEGGYDIVCDGTVARHEAVPWHLDPDQLEPIEVGGYTCKEVFAAPAEAIAALAAFLDTAGASPPWAWLSQLFEDGLVDVCFALTPRGWRALGKARPPAAAREAARAAAAMGADGVAFGVLVADAARARFFVLHSEADQHAPTVAPLLEVGLTTRPEERARDSELLTEARPGLRRAPYGPRHGVSDRRDHRRRAGTERFAARAARQAADVWRAHGVTRAVVAASPAMMGALRPALARDHSTPHWSVQELASDLSGMAPPAVHDALAEAGLLPQRGRRRRATF